MQKVLQQIFGNGTAQTNTGEEDPALMASYGLLCRGDDFNIDCDVFSFDDGAYVFEVYKPGGEYNIGVVRGQARSSLLRVAEDIAICKVPVSKCKTRDELQAYLQTRLNDKKKNQCI
jgi:hypothetical protein